MIHHFQFINMSSGWQLERVKFYPINLLVGISGVGKTRILSALRSVSDCATGIRSAPPECEWTLELSVQEQRYTWSARTGQGADKGSGLEFHVDTENLFEFRERRPSTPFLSETIATGDRILAERQGDQVTFAGNSAPKLKATESLISLFQKEATIMPVYESLNHVLLSSSAEFEFPFWQEKEVRKWQRELSSIDQLRAAVHVPLSVRFDLLQRLQPALFHEILEQFKEIFDTVTRVDVGFARDLLSDGANGEEADRLIILVQEDGIGQAVPLDELSSGMRRTLRHLVELALAPEGSTILIDEYENSLGVNCLPAVTEQLLNRTRDIQLIATSHHPYVINNINAQYWRVVTRTGGQVHVTDASDIPELNTASRQDAFIRLMNSRTYREGIGIHE